MPKLLDQNVTTQLTFKGSRIGNVSRELTCCTRKIEYTLFQRTVTVEDGAFTISSTTGGASASSSSTLTSQQRPSESAAFAPSPRFGSAMAFGRQGQTLYLFGGMVEDGDKQYTLKDLYSLGKHKGRRVSFCSVLKNFFVLCQISASWTSGRSSWSRTSSPWSGSIRIHLREKKKMRTKTTTLRKTKIWIQTEHTCSQKYYDALYICRENIGLRKFPICLGQVKLCSLTFGFPRFSRTRPPLFFLFSLSFPYNTERCVVFASIRA